MTVVNIVNVSPSETKAGLDRAFDRTLTQFERLQRMRKGQPVLPPVKVDLSL